MTLAPATAERLRFLVRVAEKEARHLALTTGRLFTSPFTPARVAELEKAHGLVPVLTDVAGRLRGELIGRGWI